MKQNYLGTYGVLKGSYMESRLKYYDFESKQKVYGDPTSTILKCVRDDENEEYILVELLTTNEKMRIKREGYELTSKPKFLLKFSYLKISSECIILSGEGELFFNTPHVPI